MPITKAVYIRPSLTEPYLKTTRAKEHLEELRKELASFRESGPCRFFFEDDLKRDRYRIKIEITDIPNRVPLIAGDLFYCLRSALDQTVWWLAKLSIQYPEGTQFPILEQMDMRRFRAQTNGVPAAAVDIIESLQPYHGPDAGAVKSRLLWRLNKLCNIDKHRRIPIHGAVLDFHFPNAPKSMIPLIEFEQENIVSVPLRFKSQMTLHPEVSLDVMFGDMEVGIQCTFEGIERIYSFIAENVIPRFTRFFK
jgi:hypothetical protein